MSITQHGRFKNYTPQVWTFWNVFDTLAEAAAHANNLVGQAGIVQVGGKFAIISTETAEEIAEILRSQQDERETAWR